MPLLRGVPDKPAKPYFNTKHWANKNMVLGTCFFQPGASSFSSTKIRNFGRAWSGMGSYGAYLSGTAVWGIDFFGNYINMDNSSNFISIDNPNYNKTALQFTGPFSFMILVNPNATGQNNMLWGCFDGTAGAVQLSSMLNFQKPYMQIGYGGGTNKTVVANPTSAITAGKWYVLIFTDDGSATAANSHWYIDGKETDVYSVLTDGVGSRNSTLGSSDFLVGPPTKAWGSWMNCKLGAYMFWNNRILSPGEVYRLQADPFGLFRPSKVFSPYRTPATVSSAKFRKTFSGIGSAAGKRQMIGVM